MDVLILARLQFAITTIYHFFFVPLTMGLSILVAVMETFYVRTGKEVYKRMTKFWGKLFLINFAIGVVTGIVQEFQFGMNWSEYSRYVGDIFGAPLAIEALSAFFLESTFLGLWIFGWNRLSKGMHAATMWLVAIGSNISALWILIANSFMQQPVGYAVQNGRAEMTDFFALITNPNIFLQFPHVFASAVTTAGMFMLGISAYHLLRKNETDLFQRSFRIAGVAALIGSVLVGGVGHAQAVHMVESQPMKMAAAEALWETEDPAAFSLLTITSADGTKEYVDIRIPYALSLMVYMRPEGVVYGINELQARYEEEYGPGNYIPPTIITYWTFRIMVGAGLLMIALAAYALLTTFPQPLEKITLFRKLLAKNDLFLKILVFGIALPYLANSSGWLLTEVGRFPWVVFGLVKLEDAVSPAVSAGELWISLIGYLLVYSALIVATVYLLTKYAKAGPAATDEPAPAKEPAPSLLGAQE